uniref:PD-(D/E)XK nuclease superfamily protein n=1 Tax=Candidatus Kentrum sp. FM TaxID=2126340 RepID=A0A450SKH6_9GAMM|nr:MAG: hypothetical protein BECKFM1743C_GA0114222_101335 [Candidatus Kentron sp. FM]VFK10863.1 MAG: hypothetical protein BECKFM1743B_GA0114221_101585 [Candidatus Kentron sp. FM]
MTSVATEKENVHAIRGQLPTGIETEDRFTRMLDELRRDREEQARKWDEQKQEDKRKWDEQARKWDEQARKWDEQKQEDKRKWEEQARKWDEQKQEDKRRWEEQARKWNEQKREDKRRWEEQARKWDEQKREDKQKWDEQKREDKQKWEEQKREDKRREDKWDQRFDEMHKEIVAQAVKHERSIGALGARWGMQSERAFRDALAAILEGSFGVQVINVNEFDDKGEVFGRPEQVEIDVIIKNGLMIICELKSSVSKSEMYTFERKARFYEKRRGRQANRLMVISPMIDHWAREVGDALGIEMYLDSVDVPV